MHANNGTNLAANPANPFIEANTRGRTKSTANNGNGAYHRNRGNNARK